MNIHIFVLKNIYIYFRGRAYICIYRNIFKPGFKYVMYKNVFFVYMYECMCKCVHMNV